MLLLYLQIVSVQVTEPTGRAQVDTQTPRSTGNAYWITYTAIDSSGNKGIGLRQLVIACPGNEKICWEDDQFRQSACSLNGRCVDEALSSALTTTTVSST
jgi:hypothetical protein